MTRQERLRTTAEERDDRYMKECVPFLGGNYQLEISVTLTACKADLLLPP